MCLDGPTYRFGLPVENFTVGHLPQASEQIAVVSWEWGPGHGRTDEYYLKEADDGWQLWLVDPSCPETTTAAVAVSTVPYRSPAEAGNDLLRRYWQWSEHDGLDRFNILDKASLLEAGEIEQIAERVWGVPPAAQAAPADAVALSDAAQ
jgi:hypothetical protein